MEPEQRDVSNEIGMSGKRPWVKPKVISLDAPEIEGGSVAFNERTHLSRSSIGTNAFNTPS